MLHDPLPRSPKSQPAVVTPELLQQLGAIVLARSQVEEAVDRCLAEVMEVHADLLAEFRQLGLLPGKNALLQKSILVLQIIPDDASEAVMESLAAAERCPPYERLLQMVISHQVVNGEADALASLYSHFNLLAMELGEMAQLIISRWQLRRSRSEEKREMAETAMAESIVRLRRYQGDRKQLALLLW